MLGSPGRLPDAAGECGMYHWRKPRYRFWFSPFSLILIIVIFFSALSCGAQDRFKKRNYRVRVSVILQAEELAIQSVHGIYQLIDSQGVPVCNLHPRKRYRVQCHNTGKPGKKIYRLVLNELEPDQVDVGIALAKVAIDTYKMKVKVLRTRTGEGKSQRVLVTLGSFGTMNEAHQARENLDLNSIKAIYQDHAPAVRGDVRVLNEDGTLLARDSRSLRLVPLYESEDSMRILKIRDSQWLWSGLKQARHYRGDIEFALNNDGNLTAVNELWVEYYVYSVVAAEIGTDAPTEALKAQAVAARSEAVAKIQLGMTSSDLFDFLDTPIAQTYKGKGLEAERVRKAVDATRGEILVCDGEVVDAVYSHSCGGYLANFQDLWEGNNRPYSVRKLDRVGKNVPPLLANHRDTHRWTTAGTDSLCRPSQKLFPRYARKYYRWKKSLTPEDLTSYVVKISDIGRVLDVKIDKRAGSGRVQAILVRGKDGTLRINRELEIRKVLGHLYSTFFTIERDVDPVNNELRRLDVFGAGYGHGVGMCQMGTYMMGHQGYSYRQILGHYFSQVKIRRLYR